MDDHLDPERPFTPEDIGARADLFAAAGRYGYFHPGYAESFVEAGEVRHLRRSGGWMLTRRIPDSDRRDALVGHPQLLCRDWSALPADLADTAALTDVVTITALTDPLAPVAKPVLHEAFPDLVRIDAQHFIVELASFWPERDHRRAVRRASELVEIDVEDAPRARLDDWERIGGVVGPTGIRLSRAALERQLTVPGCVGVTALDGDGPVAMALVYVSGDEAHLHAIAANERGDELGAPYALVNAVVEDMVGRGLYTLDLGAAAADDPAAGEELSRFMGGWTEQTLPSYLCGRVVDRVAYDELAAATGTTGSATFPAYRDPAVGRDGEGASDPEPDGTDEPDGDPVDPDPDGDGA